MVMAEPSNMMKSALALEMAAGHVNSFMGRQAGFEIEDWAKVIDELELARADFHIHLRAATGLSPDLIERMLGL
jgi:hypothetical protein